MHDQPEPDFSGTAFCPVCCSTVDVVCVDGEKVELDCVSCEQVWEMKIDANRFATHSI